MPETRIIFIIDKIIIVIIITIVDKVVIMHIVNVTISIVIIIIGIYSTLPEKVLGYILQ